MTTKRLGLIFGLLGFSCISSANDGLSFQGYVGLINIPNTSTTEQETIQFQYSNQMQKTRGEYIDGHNYIVSFGLLPFLDVNGRIATDTNNDNLYERENWDQSRDLSLNIKTRFTFIPEEWFALALGVQDLGGETDHYDSQYLVASKQVLEQTNLIVGVGQSDNVLGRMDGVFGGIEWTPVKNMSLLFEHDASEFNAGLRYSYYSKAFDFPFRLDFTGQLVVGEAKTENDFYYGIGVKIPLGNAKNNRLNTASAQWIPAPAKIDSSNQSAQQTTVTQDSPLVQGVASNGNTEYTIPEQRRMAAELIQSKLVKIGFHDVNVGFNQDKMVVQYENNIFNQNEIDGMGVVLGVAVANAYQLFPEIKITMYNQDIPMVSAQVQSKLYYEFLTEPCRLQYINCVPESNVRALIDVWFEDDEESQEQSQYIWLGRKNDYRFKPQIMLTPSINSGIATEYGVLDYSLSLQTNLQLPIFKGFALSMDWDSTPLLTDDVQDGEALSYMQHQAGLRNLFANYTYKFMPNLMNTLSVGKYKIDYAGVQNESIFWLSDNVHQFKYKLGCFKNEKNSFAFPNLTDCQDSSKQRDLYTYSLLSYRYFNNQYNSSLEITTGRFWEQESGFSVVNNYYMGDVIVSLNYNQTDDKTFGIGVTLPLTPRKDFSNEFFQLRGDEHWLYRVTTIVDQQTNFLSNGVGVIPNPTHNLARVYLNNDRLNIPYIKKNLFRMRDAFIQYGAE